MTCLMGQPGRGQTTPSVERPALSQPSRTLTPSRTDGKSDSHLKEDLTTSTTILERRRGLTRVVRSLSTLAARRSQLPTRPVCNLKQSDRLRRLVHYLQDGRCD